MTAELEPVAVEDVATVEDLTTMPVAADPDAGRVVLPSGKVVYVRGMTGFEVSLMSKRAQGDSIKSNQFAIAMAMVNPKLSDAQALAWMKIRPAGEMKAVMDRIDLLSGLTEGSEGAAYKSV